MSTNKSPITSRYNRKENYQSLNFPNISQPVSPVRTYQFNDPSLNKKSVQQKQIEDLQQKVDLILQHNDKLVSQNAELKRKLSESELIVSTNMQKQRLSRYHIAQQSDYSLRKLNSQLMIKARELEHMLSQFQAFKEITRRQGQSMREIIHSLTLSNQALKAQNLKFTQDQLRIKQEMQADNRMMMKQAERKIKQQGLHLQKQKNQELAREKAYWNKVNKELADKYQQERKQFQNRKNILITKLQQNHSKEIEELRQQLNSQFNQQIAKIQDASSQKCKQQRQKADQLIKECMQNFGQNNYLQNQQLKQQIKALKESLDSRKRFIDQLISSDTDRQPFQSTFDELNQMKNRLKEEIEHLMRENEVLKIKTAEKYQLDLKQAVRIYEDKIQILSTQVRSLSDQNDRLRHNYEDQLTSKIRHRRNWEIQVGQHKNLIRKLKAQLRGVQDEFRLNIQGVRDQNATFSMTLMKSVVQQKDKSNFLEEQNRKLRELYDRHEKEVEAQKLQAQQKVKYYESKVWHMKRQGEEQKKQLRQRQLMFQNKLNERQNNLRANIKKQRERLQQIISQSDEAKEKLQKQYFDCKQKCCNLELELKDSKENNQNLTSKIKQNEEHIERLRMELQVAGVDQTQKNATIDNWKQHYEGIILKLESDKKQLKLIIDGLHEGNEKLVYRQRRLEQQLKKAAIQISKRGELDKKVIKLGLDENLVKNMSEIWTRSASKLQR